MKRWVERLNVRCVIWTRVEPRVRGLVSLLLELEEDEPIPLSYMLVNMTTDARSHLVIMLREEFNMPRIPKRAWVRWRTYADLVKYVVRRIERFLI